MSNYHVKTISDDGRKASVVFHIPIPNENNSAVITLRSAVSQYVGVFTSQIPWLLAGEILQLENGEFYEYSETVTFKDGITNLQKQNALDSNFTVLSVSILEKIRTRLKFWGKDRNI